MAANNGSGCPVGVRNDERLKTVEREMGEVRNSVRKLELANALDTRRLILWLALVFLGSGGGSMLADFIQVAGK